ncbi:MAG TPA: hypothetical protein VFW65_29290 [Pseudonocardiaceae bacterium]|nr:hypothetical protein [Pseudonocardiaceae bacterium]
MTLIVAWRKGTALESGSVPLTTSVADELRGICRGTLSTLDQLHERQWHPDALNEADEYLVASFEQLGSNSETLRVVQAREFNVLHPATLPAREFLFYALIAGPRSRRVAFIRKYNIRRGLRRKLVAIFDDTLDKIDAPIFTFDDYIDVVVDQSRGVAILGMSAFQLLFRSSPEILARTPEYVANIADSLPMDADAMSTLIDVAQNNLSVQRRLQAIEMRGHLKTVSMNQIKDEMRKHHIDARKFIVNGKLVFDRADVRDIIKLLNEDLFLGGLTNQDFQVDRKSPR